MKLYAAVLDFDGVAEEFGVERTFPAHLHEQAAVAGDRFADAREDLVHMEFVTIDPEGSRDLDQAVCIEGISGGFRVHYAIADVAAFIEPGSDLEAESLRRGQTIYLPDGPARLHPEELSENRASLLAGEQRPAVVWSIDLDAEGEIVDSAVLVRRAMVKSRARLDYDQAQADMDAGTLHPSIELLPEVGRLRRMSALRRRAINLNIPSQRVVRVVDPRQGGHYEIIIEPRHPIMDYNSEISLLTGMVAGNMMVDAGHGLLRTLAPATGDSEATFRAEARALGYPIAPEQHIGEFLQGVDSDSPNGMAVQREAQKLLRGSGYLSITREPAEVHSGVGGYYAHVTAPLRRLVDRFATEHCLAIAAGAEVPEWVVETQDRVVESMRATSILAGQVDNACLDLTEATVLEPWVAQNFRAVVLTSDGQKGQSRLFVADPPVLAACLGAPRQGTTQEVTLIRADVDRRIVQFVWPAD
ncbi:ribonuclease catalytic domain-containing protein [Corynebacterium pacaense]|uniref:ribonuclease catalytic domain-containing protein n=1 Tax=Corynebacterium pacaense TaxID=1816684 RepID=UPI0009BB3165|nr:RNB domain-containing ribonuclease [Corynebacterium pacaense]